MRFTHRLHFTNGLRRTATSDPVQAVPALVGATRPAPETRSERPRHRRRWEKRGESSHRFPPGTLWAVALIAYDLLKLAGVVPDRWSDKWGY